MTEADARTLLSRAGYGDFDAWIAAAPWRPMPEGWWVVPKKQGWQFRVEVATASRLRLTAFPPDAAPAVWLVPAVKR